MHFITLKNKVLPIFPIFVDRTTDDEYIFFMITINSETVTVEVHLLLRCLHNEQKAKPITQTNYDKHLKYEVLFLQNLSRRNFPIINKSKKVCIYMFIYLPNL